MEIMDPFLELEQMALNATAQDGQDQEPSDDDVARWQKFFHYSCTDALEAIKQQRNNYSRLRVSEEHWKIVETEKRAEGYDREAYEHELEIGRSPKSKPSRGNEGEAQPSSAQAANIYLVKLEGILDTADKIQHIAKLSELPISLHANGDDGDNALFCQINGMAKYAILQWLYAQNITFRPTFVRLFEKARKDLSGTSMCPTLGIDSTLPQYRAANNTPNFHPSQNQYPVWYFFYGTLADADILSRQLSLQKDQRPILKTASISGGILTTWASKYRALIDGPATSHVHGSAYLVQSREHEEALRAYETDNYEVVRCTISMDELEVQGCSFRFIGSSDSF